MSPKTNALDIKKDIEYAIIRGEYNGNYKMPSINDIMELYQCCKGTAVKVIDLMEDEGTIIKKKGIGCFLIPQKNIELVNKYKSKSKDELYTDLVRFKEIGLSKTAVSEMFGKILDDIYRDN